MIHENNCKDLIWKTLILKSICQHVKNSLNSNLRIFPNSKRIRTLNEKNVRTGASKTYFQVFSTGVLNIFVILKMIFDLVTQKI